MQLRRFTADTTPAALGAVRMALGDEAIILSNRKQGNLIEIIATGKMDDAATLSDLSVDDIQEKIRSATGNLVKSVETSQHNRMNTTVSSSDLERSFASSGQDIEPKVELNEEVESQNQQLSSERIPANVVVGVTQAEMVGMSADLEAKVSESADSLMFALSNQAQKMEDHFKSLAVNIWGATHSGQSQHFKKLLSLGIGAELSVNLVEKAESDASLDKALRSSYLTLASLLPVADDMTLSIPGVTIVSGAPGSGKTTTLVKLAAEHVKNHSNQSIVFICTNTRKIGAFEELEAYGRLLGVPTVHAHDTDELANLIAAFSHKKLVLIDHTLPNDPGSVLLPECLTNPTVSDSVRHLFVLSASTQALTIDHLIASHCTAGNISCVLTHLDSTARLGELLSSIIRYRVPISYCSDSASVEQSLQKSEAAELVGRAVDMAARIRPSADDVLLQRLIQPSNAIFSRSVPNINSDIMVEL